MVINNTLQEIEDEIEDLYYDLFDAQTEQDWKLADKIQRDIRELERQEQLARRG
jgi:hypothetical protein